MAGNMSRAAKRSKFQVADHNRSPRAVRASPISGRCRRRGACSISYLVHTPVFKVRIWRAGSERRRLSGNGAAALAMKPALITPPGITRETGQFSYKYTINGTFFYFQAIALMRLAFSRITTIH